MQNNGAQVKNWPERIGPYVVVERFESGGMAAVYKAVDPVSQQLVVLKVARGQWRDALQAEADVLRRLDYPNVVKIRPIPQPEGAEPLYVGREDVAGEPSLYIVLEYLEGGSLRGVLDSAQKSGRRLGQSEIVRITSQIAAALDHAHTRGIIHLDVKPSNILLSKDQRRVVLTDFGTVRTVGAAEVGTNIGTPLYMAPEHALGAEVDGRADVYSFGVVLYELLTGRTPYDGNWTGVLRKLRNGEAFPRPRALRADLPLPVEATILKALERDPSARFASCLELSVALQKSFRGGILFERRYVGAVVGVVLLMAAVFYGVDAAGGAAPGRPVVSAAEPATAGSSTTTSLTPTTTRPAIVLATAAHARSAPAGPTATTVILALAGLAPAPAVANVAASAPGGQPTATLAPAQSIPSPTLTPAATATAIPTAPPTVTALPTPAPSSTAAPPTVTAMPSPTPPPVPTATPAPSFPPPVLNPPAVVPGAVTLSWSYGGQLGPDDIFDVRVWRAGQPAAGIANTKSTSYAIGGSFPGGDYNWTIAVIRKQNGVITTLAVAGQTGHFTWTPAGGGSGGPCGTCR